MAGVSIMEEFEIHENPEFLEKAERYKTSLIRKQVQPKQLSDIYLDEHGETVVRAKSSAEDLGRQTLKKGDSICLDFGTHYVGYVTLKLSAAGSHQDAPAYLRLKFAEAPAEITADSADYDGWISRGWLQEEELRIDVLPATVQLPRRYAFRYLQISVLDTSLKYRVRIEAVSLESVSAVDRDTVLMEDHGDAMLNAIEQISVHTLQECMQDVFEDGPKRDRRLWLGDFRLQAAVNYVTFRNMDLVKRCLYLFGGLTFNDDRISACLFLEPKPEPDDTYLMDYALFFVPTLVDYLEQTGDREAAEDLYEIAMKQIDNSLRELDENHLVVDQGDAFWCFVDWEDGLNKQASAQAILIYCMRSGVRLAEMMQDADRIAYLQEQIEQCTQAAICRLWDEKEQFFVSGPDRQISWASQIWMILAQVFDLGTNRELLARTMEKRPEKKIVTPYLYHHFIEALLACGQKELAKEKIREYWGGMVQEDADTFWELYNPENKNESPYGSSMVNSYCHAWSCTPAYLLKKL